MLLLLLSACLIPPESLDARVDGDGDGYASLALGGPDCDDADPTVHPGAEEGCEALDRDCDGLLGTDDVDKDGFPGCEECNDSDPDVNPAAQEICDDAGVDEDCDGAVNGEDDSVNIATGVPHWPDLDGDGLGDVTQPQVLACEGTLGLSMENSDCDDSDPWVPMPREWCRNGVNDTCDGSLADQKCVQVNPIEDGEAHLKGDLGTQFGRAVAIIPDVDGDGLADLAVSAPQWGVDVPGAVFLFSGTSLGNLRPADALLRIDGTRPGDYLGLSIRSADVDQDGQPELILAAPGAVVSSGKGAVHIIDLPSAGGSQSLSYGGPLLEGHPQGSGAWYVGLGAVEFADNTLLAAYNLPLSPDSKVAGYSHVIQGREGIDDADWVRNYSLPLSPTQGGVAFVDVSGDGVADLTVGSTNDSKALVLFGPFSGEADAADVPDLEFSSSLTEFGEAVEVFDADGDGEVELALSGRKYGSTDNSHALAIYTKLTSNTPEVRWRLQGGLALGIVDEPQTLAGGHDLDEDGIFDLVWGQPEADQLWFIYSGLPAGGGIFSGTDLNNSLAHHVGRFGHLGDVKLGYQVALGDDVNGDGRPDVLASSIIVDDTSVGEASEMGQVSLLWGGRW